MACTCKQPSDNSRFTPPGIHTVASVVEWEEFGDDRTEKSIPAIDLDGVRQAPIARFCSESITLCSVTKPKQSVTRFGALSCCCPAGTITLLALSCLVSFIYASIQFGLSIHWISRGASNPLLSHHILLALFTYAVTGQVLFRFIRVNYKLNLITIQLLITLALACLLALFTLAATFEQWISSRASIGPDSAEPVQSETNLAPWVTAVLVDESGPGTTSGLRLFLWFCGLLSPLFPVQNVLILRSVLGTNLMPRLDQQHSDMEDDRDSDESDDF